MEEVKKIAVVCNYVLNSDRIGGMDRFFVAYDEILNEKGITVHWYFTEYIAFDFYKGLTIYSSDNEIVEQFFIKKAIEENQLYDVVITHFITLCTSFFKKVKQIGIPYTIAVDHNPRPLHGFSFTKKLKNKLKGVLYARYIDVFVAVSLYSKKHLVNDFGSHLKSKINIINNGVDTSLFTKKKHANKNKFIVTSHLRRSKGIQDLIKAVSLLDDLIKKDIQIDIYGEGNYQEELKRLIKEYQLTTVINFKGSVSNLYKIYSDYNFLIHPSYGETFCYSVIESLMSNVPVITTHEGGNVLGVVKENQNGYLFHAGDSRQLSKILKKIILKQMNISSDVDGQIKENYSLQTMVDNHVNLITCI